MNNKVFVSGPITGVPDYREKFAEAADEINHPAFWEEHTTAKYAMRHGRLMEFRAVCPPTFTLRGLPIAYYPWTVCMAVCLWHLLGCSHVYMLRGWQNSRGARIEHAVARLTFKNIILQ